MSNTPADLSICNTIAMAAGRGSAFRREDIYAAAAGSGSAKFN